MKNPIACLTLLATLATLPLPLTLPELLADDTTTTAQKTEEKKGSAEKKAEAEKPEAEKPGPGKKVIKSDAEWARLLTQPQFMVTRRKATEPAFSGKYVHSKTPGTFTCVCCGADLFSSKAKFESGTGWPSFWRPIEPQNIATAPDFSEAEPRVEVECSTCGAHLGHVFSDGPPPTGLRYCINSLSLKLVPTKGATDAKASKSASTTKKTKSKATAARSRTKPTAKAKGKAAPADTPPTDDPAPPDPGDQPPPSSPK